MVKPTITVMDAQRLVSELIGPMSLLMTVFSSPTGAIGSSKWAMTGDPSGPNNI